MTIREALGQIESGNNDRARGRNGERSRFQVLPEVWNEQSNSRSYLSDDQAWGVAQGILTSRIYWFQRATGRTPTDAELYALWHRPGLFERVGYRFERLPKRVKERARRFENLRNEK